jgi:alkylated DNA repair dioxygenase AlkB
MGEQMKFFKESGTLEIPGFRYVPEFVTAEEERELIRQIENGTWTHEFARRRQHYGIGYGKQDFTNPSPLPSWIPMIARRIVSAGLFSRMPVQALVNEYEPGQGISAHKDYEPFDEVASLSLASGCLMEFEKPKAQRKVIWLEPRSLVVLMGDARHQWTHAIRPRLADVVHGIKIPRERRLSLTVRTIGPKENGVKVPGRKTART